ncbi:MAG TPA: PP2C family protein-serine/threonine phosphatase [Acidimicrobiales bacterium]|nr:PP2C family protein-serine/threonine phosphatase [Acidimicrobiales bacterium]
MTSLLEALSAVPADDLCAVVDMAGAALGATASRMLVADYALTSLRELGDRGPDCPFQLIEGTVAGRCFAFDEIVVVADPPTVYVPMTDGSERLGVLELAHASWSDDVATAAEAIVQLLVLLMISKRRYTDIVHQTRRAEPLSVAAEMQWALLPPLACSTDHVSASGILEPAYAIGGDTFDYALSRSGLDFAIVDAVGHGLPAVSISAVTVNGLRNARREERSLEVAYLDTDATLRSQFTRSAYATAQFGSLSSTTGELTWLNAGHPLPLLVRDATFIGEVPCRPSLPMGLGGSVTEIAVAQLQPGDRVLFYTDGVTESQSPGGETFGVDRLADLLVRGAADGTSPAESVRRLVATVVEYNDRRLRDDATLFMLEYHGNHTS